jgi:hypothetical protein
MIHCNWCCSPQANTTYCELPLVSAVVQPACGLCTCCSSAAAAAGAQHPLVMLKLLLLLGMQLLDLSQ